MYIIGPVRTAHFGRCRSFPNRFRIRRKAAADLGGGYFFRSTPNLIAAITSISNAMVSAVLMRSPPLRENNRTVLTGEPHHTRFALLCQFSAPPAGRLLLCARLTPCFTQNASEALWDLPEGQSSGFALIRKGRGLRPPSPCTPFPFRGVFGGGSRCPPTRRKHRGSRQTRTHQSPGTRCSHHQRAAQHHGSCSSRYRIHTYSPNR